MDIIHKCWCGHTDTNHMGLDGQCLWRAESGGQCGCLRFDEQPVYMQSGLLWMPRAMCDYNWKPDDQGIMVVGGVAFFDEEIWEQSEPMTEPRRKRRKNDDGNS